ncbi:rasGEF domain-containing protein [Planoprotostelium fungivorum]|uniref:RasGEF domain-containing protein n=1 Tax=Planoprotostelium fungivorum TaxID=1890364 RepID=A0A2P6N1D8_9EUKA|nr:rasGEF domain-containing protein [Planoprotostelium fungivorum]
MRNSSTFPSHYPPYNMAPFVSNHEAFVYRGWLCLYVCLSCCSGSPWFVGRESVKRQGAFLRKDSSTLMFAKLERYKDRPVTGAAATTNARPPPPKEEDPIIVEVTPVNPLSTSVSESESASSFTSSLGLIDPDLTDIWSQPDTPENILFEESDKGNPKLIDKLTNDSYHDVHLSRDLLLTFRSFTNPKELLGLLIKRFNVQQPKNLSYGDLQEWIRISQRSIRLRVINFIKNWLETYPKDFVSDVDQSNNLHTFIHTDIMNSAHQTPGEQLKKILSKKIDNPERTRSPQVFSGPPPKPLLPNVKKSGGGVSFTQLSFMDVPAEELARQITLREFQMFERIKPWELLNQAWTKKTKMEDAPNVMRLITQFNNISNWVAAEILKVETLKGRIAALSKCIDMGRELYNMNNMNGAMEVIAGLQSAPVFRLKNTWEGLSSRQKDNYDELEATTHRRNNYAKLRQHLHQCDPPLIPYPGIYLTDIIFIEDGNPDYIANGLINWTKRRRLSTVIKEVQTYQLKAYNFESISFLQTYLDEVMSSQMSEKDAYDMSLLREPKTDGYTQPASNSPTLSPTSPTPEKSTEKGSKKLAGIFGKTKKDKVKLSDSPLSPRSDTSPTPFDEEEEEFELEVREGYPFSEKDSPNNIVIRREGLTREVIVAATLPKLVERLTFEKYTDSEYYSAFLSTFTTFTTPSELLDLLIERFHIPSPVDHSPEVLERFQRKKERPIALRVLNIIKIWVDRSFEDFTEHNILTKLLNFVENSMIQSALLCKAGTNLKQTIQGKNSENSVKRIPSAYGEPPKSILPSVQFIRSPLDMHPTEFARQLSIMDWHMLTDVNSREFIHYEQPDGTSLYRSPSLIKGQQRDYNLYPNIDTVINRFKELRGWVRYVIACSPEKETRARLIEFFIQAAQECVNMENYHSASYITAALDCDEMMSMKNTWLEVQPDITKQFLKLKEILAPEGNWKEIRERLHKVRTPPLQLILDDITNIRRDVPDMMQHLINFDKRHKIHLLIEMVTGQLQHPWCLQPVDSIKEYLTNLEVDEETTTKWITQWTFKDGDDRVTESWNAIFTRPNKPGRSRTLTTNPFVKQKKEKPEDINSPITLSISSSNMHRASLSPEKAANMVAIPRGTVRRLSNNFKRDDILSALQRSPTPPTTIRRLSTVSIGSEMSLTEKDDVVSDDASIENYTELTELDKMRDVIKRCNERHAQAIDEALKNHFQDAELSKITVHDKNGQVFGWPDDIIGRVISRGAQNLVAPLLECTMGVIGKNDLSVIMRSHKLLCEQLKIPHRLVVLGTHIEPSVLQMLTKMGGTWVTTTKINASMGNKVFPFEPQEQERSTVDVEVDDVARLKDEEVEPVTWSEMGVNFLYVLFALSWVLIVCALVCGVPYYSWSGQKQYNPLKHALDFRLWWYNGVALVANTVVSVVVVQVFRLPFGVLLQSLVVIALKPLNEHNFSPEERKEKSIIQGQQEHRKAILSIYLFYYLCMAYLAAFAYSNSVPLQVTVNIIFGLFKYIFKWYTYGKYLERCGIVTSNFVVLLMESLHQLFCSVLFISHADIPTIVINLALETFMVVRMAVGTADWYNRAKQRLIKMLSLKAIDNWLNNSLISDDFTVHEIRRFQIGYLNMVLISNLVTMVGGMAIVLTTRLTKNEDMFPFGNPGLSKISSELHADPLSAAAIVIVGTNGILVVVTAVALMVIKCIYRLHSVTESLRLFSRNKVLAATSCLVAYSYLIIFMGQPIRVYNYLYPDAYGS